jgi:Flp pilus assembly protein TadG
MKKRITNQPANIPTRGKCRARLASQRGHAFMEMAFFAPILFFLFIGIFDLGFYTYALISTQSAARVAAEYTSASSTTAADSSGACSAVLDVLRKLPNIGSTTTSCGSAPVIVTASSITASDGSAASKATVTYRSVSLIPIPGILMSQLNVTRSVTMRVRS